MEGGGVGGLYASGYPLYMENLFILFSIFFAESLRVVEVNERRKTNGKIENLCDDLSVIVD